MVYLYIAAWILCMVGMLLHKRYVFCIGSRVIKKVYDTKILSVIEFVILLLVFLLITSNRTGLDILSYVQTYESEIYDYTREPLYTLLRCIFYKMGISFYIFRAVLTLFSGLMAISTVKKLGVDLSFVLLFYLPSMVFTDSMQFRNAVAFSVMVWSLKYFVVKEKYAVVKYVICTVLIAQIHTAYYFALIMVVGFLKKTRKRVAALIFATGIFVSGITLLNGKQVPMLVFFLEHFLAEGDSRIWKYNTSGNLGWVIPTGIHIITIVIAVIVNRYMHKDCFGITRKQLEYLDVIFVYNLVLFLTVPAIMMNMHYYRLIRGAFILNVIGFSFLFQKKMKMERLQYIVLGVVILLTGLWYMLDMVVFENSTVMAGPVLEGILFFLQ